MNNAHGTGLYMDHTGRLHRLAAHSKLVGTLGFVAAVVATPREQWWSFVADGVIVAMVAVLAGLPLGLLARRLTIELPFIAFALLMPFVGNGPTVRLAGVNLSQAGLWSAWSIVAKGTLGVAATVVLASTTAVPQLITGFERLRVPRALTAIGAFMIRYLDVVTGELQRMRVARESRGDRARWLWQAKAVGAGAGALFVRSYERGERVFLAMESRGYTGTLPSVRRGDEPRHWAACLAPAALASACAIAAWRFR
ncbi:MAG: cobalt ABC transporter inner membrane subunit CbiQ [Acidimicrobiaceae bacterium]|nr:MAG: cobalt ABC transporter inner membrane subunit CbiQ [Acidimicrobiaceae bacterium]